MASGYKRGPSSRRASEPVYISGSDDYSIEEEDIVSEEQNNRRLRQAIGYLATGGGFDALDLYIDRVQKIDDLILQQYAEEEYLFDSKLYQQLKAMVRKVQTDSSQSDEDDVDMLTNSEDIEALEQEALLREHYKEDIGASDQEAVTGDRAKAEAIVKVAEDAKASEDTKTAAREKQLAIDRAGKAAVGQPRKPVQTSAPKTTQPTAQETVQTVAQTPTPRRHDRHVRHGQPQASVRPGCSAADKDKNVPREVVWRYGGPKNDPEQYHQNFPASLPFGETLYMQEWESMKIDFDLNAGANRKADDPPVITNVSYDKVKLLVGKNPFDSGSRFKLPEEDSKISKWLKDDKGELLRKTVHNFNQGGNLKAAEGKDYAPRIWLPKIIVGKQEHFPHARPREASLASRISIDVLSKPTSSATKLSSSRIAGPSGTQINLPIVNTSKSILSASLSLYRTNQIVAAQKLKSSKQTMTVTGTRTRNQSASTILKATTTGRRKFQTPTRVDSAHDELAEIYAEHHQAKTRENNEKPQVSSSPNKLDSRRSINPIVRVQNPKHLPPQSPPRTPVIRQTVNVPPRLTVKRGPGRPRKVCPPDSPPKPTLSSPNARMIEKQHPSGANAAPRRVKRKLSDGSKRFTPKKKVCFNEDNNEEFSADEGVVKKAAKKVKKAVAAERPKSSSHTRSGRRFLPSPVL
jgi:hypothetical protein